MFLTREMEEGVPLRDVPKKRRVQIAKQRLLWKENPFYRPASRFHSTTAVFSIDLVEVKLGLGHET